MEVPGGESGLSFDLLAASIRADAGDLRTFLEALATKLEGSLPGMVLVQREGGFFKKEHKVDSIRIQVEDHLYEINRAGSALEAKLGHQVRGISLKNKIVSLDEWIDALSRDLAKHADSSAQARAALGNLLQ